MVHGNPVHERAIRAGSMPLGDSGLAGAASSTQVPGETPYRRGRRFRLPRFPGIKPGIIFVVHPTMKPTLLHLLLLAPCAGLYAQTAADSTGLPGDDFSLRGALELFKRNIEMEKFEEELNTDSTRVNNLDLDGNGETDYVRVETRRDGEAVYILMTVATSATENQDVAVIGIERTGEESATLQIIGDEDLYGPDAIVEPYAEEERMAPSKGPRAPALEGVFVVMNVWSWRPIPWCFSPRYYPYASPWGWAHYPVWWRPWRPHPWGMWWGWRHHHHGWYRPWNACRVGRAQAFYAPRRARSAMVQGRFRDAHQRHLNARPARSGTVRPGQGTSPSKVRPARTEPGKVRPQRRAAPKGTQPMTRPPKGGGGKKR